MVIWLSNDKGEVQLGLNALDGWKLLSHVKKDKGQDVEYQWYGLKNKPLLSNIPFK